MKRAHFRRGEALLHQPSSVTLVIRLRNRLLDAELLAVLAYDGAEVAIGDVVTVDVGVEAFEFGMVSCFTHKTLALS